MPFFICEIGGRAAIRFNMELQEDGRCREYERFCESGKVIVFAPDGSLVPDVVAERVAEMFGRYLEGEFAPRDRSREVAL